MLLYVLWDSGNKSHSHALKLVSALSFTLAIAAVWEFYEYAMDTFFGMDMQQDTIVSGINSISKHLDEAIEIYNGRNRRFGGI